MLEYERRNQCLETSMVVNYVNKEIKQNLLPDLTEKLIQKGFSWYKQKTINSS